MSFPFKVALGPAATPSGWQKIAIRYGNGKMRAAVNGTLGDEADFDGDWGLTDLTIGNGISGKVREVKTYARPLSDSQLARLTA